MKIKFNSDCDSTLQKTLELHNMIIVVRGIFYKNDKYYLQGFLDECL